MDSHPTDELILQHLHLPSIIARNYAKRLPPHFDYEDLACAGIIGLFDAANRFDPSRQVMFKTYASRKISFAMKDYLRSLDWAPPSLRIKINALKKAKKKLRQISADSENEEELCREMNISTSDLQKLNLQKLGLKLLSLEFENDGKNLDGYMPLTRAVQEDSVYASEIKYILTQAVRSISKREQMLVSLYYCDDLTMKEIGVILNINRSRVSQLLKIARSRLREFLKHETCRARIL